MGNKKAKKDTSWRNNYKTFEAVLGLPVRLAIIFRQVFRINKDDWDFCLDALRRGSAYRTWTRSKGRNKKGRPISSPIEPLMFVQRKILDNFLTSFRTHANRHSNTKGCSTVTALEMHVKKNLRVREIDLMNAFPTVKRSRIKGVLKGPFFKAIRKEFEGVEISDDDLANMLEALADLLCLKDTLPQGTCSSPKLFDICCYAMDCALTKLLLENQTSFQKYTYTAIVDNLVFSSTDEIPQELVDAAMDIIRNHGFIPHTKPEKNRYYSPQTGTVPKLLGLVLTPDGSITMAPRKVNQFRARLYQYLKMSEWSDTIRAKVNGDLGYIKMIYPNKLPAKLRKYVSMIQERKAIELTRKSLQRISDVDLERLPRDIRLLVEALKPDEVGITEEDIPRKTIFPNVVFVDGATRKNPGASAVGAVLKIDGEPDQMVSGNVGLCTNNMAEFFSVIAGIELAKKQGVTDMLDVCSDSELVVKMLNHKCKINKAELRTLYLMVMELKKDIENIRFVHIPRESNVLAHTAAHNALDALDHFDPAELEAKKKEADGKGKKKKKRRKKSRDETVLDKINSMPVVSGAAPPVE